MSEPRSTCPLSPRIKSKERRRVGIPFVLSAPSGGGKTTIRQKVLKVLSNVIASISCTTRPARPEELEGVDYHFISEDEFDRMARDGEFAEWATVHNNRYGTPARLLEEKLAEGFDVILTLDIQGARNLKKIYPQAVTVFLLPPSFAELRERLLARGTNDSLDVEERLKHGQEMIKEVSDYDYLIVNREIGETAGHLVAIIAAERLRPWRVLAEVS